MKQNNQNTYQFDIGDYLVNKKTKQIYVIDMVVVMPFLEVFCVEYSDWLASKKGFNFKLDLTHFDKFDHFKHDDPTFKVLYGK